MKIERINPPRRFVVGVMSDIEICHSANIELSEDEQVTFVAAGTEYDIVRKRWGYYVTPSLNGRLLEHGLHPVLVSNSDGKLYLLLVQAGQEAHFNQYLADERLQVVDSFGQSSSR